MNKEIDTITEKCGKRIRTWKQSNGEEERSFVFKKRKPVDVAPLELVGLRSSSSMKSFASFLKINGSGIEMEE